MELLIDDHLKFSDEHKRLLTAQIVLTDRTDKLTGTMDQLASTTDELAGKMDELTGKMDELTGKMDKLAGTMQELAEAQRHTDERLNALISVVDGLIRKPPASLEG